MALLVVDRITKRFGPEPILAGVSFEVYAGEKLSLVGPNGAGKSTLMRILAGEEELDSGRIERSESVTMAYLEQHPEFSAGQTLWEVAQDGVSRQLALVKQAEQVAAELAKVSDPRDHDRLAQQYDRLQHQLERDDAYNLDRQIEQVLEGLGFRNEAYHQDVTTLSGGQQNRALLARLLLTGADLLLLDEPSNHLDIDATEWLENYLAASRQALILVSHDRYFLDKVTTRTLELFHGTVDTYPGNFSAYWKQKAERLKVQQRTFEKQQEEIAKAEDFIRRNFHGQKHAQAKDREKKLARIERVEPPREITTPPMGLPKVDRCGDIVFRVEDLAKSYDRGLFSGLTFDVERGQRWGILGPNGTGKTTLLRCLIGEVTPDTGSVRLGTGVKVAYYDQMLKSLPDDTEVVEAIRPPHKEFNEQQRRDMLARFGLQGDIVFQPVSSLSGGERSRAALARLATLDANVLLLDEPTNHLDLWARDSLERTMLSYEGTLVFVSHDRYFLNRVADHLLVVEPGRFRVIEGGYDTYQHFIQEGLAAEARVAEPSRRSSGGSSSSTSSRSSSTSSGTSPVGGAAAGRQKGDRAENGKKRKRKFPYRKITDLEAEILDRELEIEDLQTKLIDPAVLRNGDSVREIQQELQAAQAALEHLYEHWEEATELN